jgi:hypothetical protein
MNPTVLASNQSRPYQIAVGHAHAYWTNYGEDPIFDNANTPPTQARPEGPVVPGGSVMAVPTRGGAAFAVAEEQHQPNGIAVGETHVYWTNYGLLGDGAVKRIPVRGGAPETLVSHKQYLGVVAVDATYAYFVSFYNDPTNEVMRVPPSGGRVDVLATGQNPAGILLHDEHVYWTNFDGGQVMRSTKNGTHATVLNANDLRPGMTGIAIHGDHLYLTNVIAGSVLRIPKGGGPTEELASGQSTPFRIVVDDANIYWTNMGDINSATGQVMRMALHPGGQPTALAANQAQPIGIAADHTHIYWVTLSFGSASGQVLSLPK